MESHVCWSGRIPEHESYRLFYELSVRINKHNPYGMNCAELQS